VKALTLLRARLRPLRVPGDGEPLDLGEMRALLALATAWEDRAGRRAVAARERHFEMRARRAARRA
jgi:hypothetical protein